MKDLSPSMRRTIYSKKLHKCADYLGGANATAAGKASESLDHCCVTAYGFKFYNEVGHKNRSVRKQCRHRVCPYCESISNQNVGNALYALAEQEFGKDKRLGMLTLTIKHNSDDQLKYLRNQLAIAWQKFIRTALIKMLLPNYHRRVEVERGEDNGWHPHFHLLVEISVPGRTEIRDALKKGDIKAAAANKYFKKWERAEKKRLIYFKLPLNNWDSTRKERVRKYAKATASDIEDWIRQQWRMATDQIGRESKNIRLKELVRAKEFGQVILRKRTKSGKFTAKQIPLEKALQELVKYTTKGNAIGDGKRQGFLSYTPEQVSEYLRGVKNWRIHQSTGTWSAIEKAHEPSDKEFAERDAGCNMVPWTQLVAGAEFALEKKSIDDKYEISAWKEDAKKAIQVMETEGNEGMRVNERQYEALLSHLTFIEHGEGTLIPLPVTDEEALAIQRLKGMPDLRPGLSARARRTIEQRERLQKWADEMAQEEQDEPPPPQNPFDEE